MGWYLAHMTTVLLFITLSVQIGHSSKEYCLFHIVDVQLNESNMTAS